MQSTKDTEILNSVAETYDAIAESWDRLRRRPGKVWNILLPFITEGDRVLDVGCGSGRLFEFLAPKHIQYTGVDGSSKLIEIARSRYQVSGSHTSPMFLVSPMQSLPFEDASFDVLCCMAAFHHLPSATVRLQVLNEMKRLLTPNGKLLMTNWSTYHLAVSLRLRLWPMLWGNRDALIPWRLPDGSVFERFYHAFLLSELEELLRESGWTAQKSCYINTQGITRWVGSLYSFVVATPR